MDAESIDLSLLRATALDASPAEITAILASQRAKASALRAIPVPLLPNVEVRRSRSPDQPPSPSQGSSLPRESPNERQPHSLPDTRRRMTSAGTQPSDRTDPLSQWAYEHVPGQTRSPLTGTTGFRTVPESKIYNTGEWGHVALDLEPEPEVGRNGGGFHTQEAEELNDLPEEQLEPLTELFPQSQRFQQPKTPASTTRKRKRNGVTDESITTPSLPANPFGSSAVKEAAPMRMSQVFKATQAPSSPFNNPLVSDPLSSRPSPNVHHADRPMTAHATSSPARPSEFSRRAATEPHVNWKSQTGDGARIRTSSPLQPLDLDVLSDDDFGAPPSQERRTALRTERAKATRELRSVHGQSHLNGSLRSSRKANTSGISSSIRASRRSPPVEPGDPRPTESEEETEHEEENTSKPPHANEVQDESSEFAEHNKENIAQPLNQTVVQAKTGGLGNGGNNMMSESPMEQRFEELRGHESQSEDELPISSASLLREGHQERTSSQPAGYKTIADSQRSMRSKQRASLDPTSVVLRSTEDGSGRIVCESQTLKIAASSPLVGSSVAPDQVEGAQHQPLVSNVHTGKGSRALESQPFPPGVQGPENSNEAPQLSTKENSSDFVSAQRGNGSEQTPSRSGGNATTIPETTFVTRIQPRRGAQITLSSNVRSSTQTKSSKRSSPETGIFHSARTQPKEINGVQYSVTTPGSSQPSFGPVASQPIPLMEVGRRADLAAEEESISMSPEILQNNDPLYHEVMDKYSSPISALRKRRVRESSTRTMPKKGATLEAPERQSAANENQHGTTKENGPGDNQISADCDESIVVNGQQDGPGSSAVPPTSRPLGSSTDDQDVEVDTDSGVNRDNSRTRKRPRNMPLRVFAYFSSSRPGFYPATCLSMARIEPKFKVKFDDGNVTQLASTKVKPLHLRAGDSIRVDIKGLRNINFTVRRCQRGSEQAADGIVSTDNHGNSDVVVYRSSAAGSATTADEVFSIESIYLTNQAWIAFRRDFKQEDLALLTAPGLSTPSERPSSPVTPNSRSRRSGLKDSVSRHARVTASNSGSGVFEQVVFVMTNIDPPSFRDEIARRITQNAGRVLKEGFEDLFVDEGNDAERTHSASLAGKALQRSSSPPSLASSPPPSKLTALHPRAEFGKQSVFLLATRHCRHTKYFQALALGIPCLSIRWVEQCIAKGTLLPWHNFLLASGESSFLDDAVVSQSSTVARLSTRFALQDLVDRHRSLLDQQRILLLNLDDSRTSQLDAHYFLSLALGALEVYRAADLDEARELLEERNESDSTHRTLTLVIGSASELIDTSSAAATSSTRTTKRRRGGGRRSDRDRENEEETASTRLTQLVAPYPELRGVSTEFVIQSLIQGCFL